MKEKIMFDELVDDIVNRIDPAGHNTDGLKKHYRLKLSILVNQEVERRIKERMPSELDVMRRVRNRKDYLRELGYPTQVLVKYGDAIIETIDWLRSRLTQKTEGGGE